MAGILVTRLFLFTGLLTVPVGCAPEPPGSCEVLEGRGAAGKARMHVNPSTGHRVDPDAVLEALPKT